VYISVQAVIGGHQLAGLNANTLQLLHMLALVCWRSLDKHNVAAYELLFPCLQCSNDHCTSSSLFEDVELSNTSFGLLESSVKALLCCISCLH
jgi:hypothetical protein